MAAMNIPGKQAHDFTSYDGFVGLLIPGPTGIIYQAQAGGIRNDHPALEGWFWPMNWRVFEQELESALLDYPCHEYSGKDDERTTLENALSKWDLEQVFRAPSLEKVRAQLDPYSYGTEWKQYRHGTGLVPTVFGEAWVPVVVRPPSTEFRLNSNAPPQSMSGRCMILTYPNSD